MRFVAIEGRGRPRAVVVVSLQLLFLLTSLLGSAWQAPLTAAVLRRRDDGVELASGPVEAMMRNWLRDMMNKDLKRLSEPEFLTRWGDATQWARMYYDWPAGVLGAESSSIRS